MPTKIRITRLAILGSSGEMKHGTTIDSAKTNKYFNPWFAIYVFYQICQNKMLCKRLDARRNDVLFSICTLPNGRSKEYSHTCSKWRAIRRLLLSIVSNRVHVYLCASMLLYIAESWSNVQEHNGPTPMAIASHFRIFNDRRQFPADDTIFLAIEREGTEFLPSDFYTSTIHIILWEKICCFSFSFLLSFILVFNCCAVVWSNCDRWVCEKCSKSNSCAHRSISPVGQWIHRKWLVGAMQMTQNKYQRAQDGN